MYALAEENSQFLSRREAAEIMPTAECQFADRFWPIAEVLVVETNKAAHGAFDVKPLAAGLFPPGEEMVLCADQFERIAEPSAHRDV